MSLESDFDAAMLGIYIRAKSEVGYNATFFLQMLHRDRGVLTAKKLINSANPSEGYTALYMAGRLDLTVEALIVDNTRWHSLFTPAEIEAARKRLLQYQYSQ